MPEHHGDDERDDRELDDRPHRRGSDGRAEPQPRVGRRPHAEDGEEDDGHREACVRFDQHGSSMAGPGEWSGDVEIVQGDAGEPEQVRAAMVGVDVLYYLLHSIGTGGDFGDTEREMARRSPT